MLFLEGEGRIKATSAGQYLSAISTVHKWHGIGDFCASDWITRRLLRAWKNRAPDTAYTDSIAAFPAAAIESLLDLGRMVPSPADLRAVLATVIDFCFFSRADSCFGAAVLDVRVRGHSIEFRERRRKGQQVDRLQFRTRLFDCRGCPGVLILVARWTAARTRAWAEHTSVTDPARASFWGLPGEPPLTARTVQIWFKAAVAMLQQPDLASFTHHSLRKGGATAAFSLGVAIWKVADWGGWSLRSDAIHRYLDMSHQPTPSDFRFFGWLRAAPDRLQAQLGHLFD